MSNHYDECPRCGSELLIWPEERLKTRAIEGLAGEGGVACSSYYDCTSDDCTFTEDGPDISGVLSVD